MAAPRARFIIVFLIVLATAAFCGSRVFSQDRAKPRDGSRGGQTQSERRRSNPPPQTRQRSERSESGRSQARPQERRQERTERSDAQRRRPRPEAAPRRNDNRSGDRNADRNRGYRPTPQQRHPRADGHYRGDLDRYHWRNWQHRRQYDRDRFPRFYFGLRLFDGYRYRGHNFGPHYRLWYFYGAWRMCYWPYAYPPSYGCGNYWVPTDRRIVYDPQTGEEYWDYTDYRYVYLCID